MAFKNNNGIIEWVPPTKDDKVSFRKKLSKQNAVVPLTYDLKNKVDEALRNIAPQNNASAFSAANSSVYNIVKKLIKTPPGVVDIIVPVYNSFHIVKKCLDKVLNRTHWPFHLYIIDDASDDRTREKLKEFAAAFPNKITLLRNSKNRGFAATVNRGIKHGTGRYVCLLNSDVLVTDLWLTKMVMAIEADERNQIVCPATNNTAIVDVALSPGASYIQTNKVFESFTTRRYPEIMPTGFCFLFRRDLLDKIGYFDEAYKNFGEESDFWWRTIRYADNDNKTYKRYKAVLADDAYVFHERGSSFSQLGSEAHMHLRKLASGRFNDLWPEWIEWKKTFNVNKALGNLREKIPAPLLRSPTDKYHICWVVSFAEMCGGMAFIKDIVNEFNERNVDAKVVVIKANRESKENYLGELTTAPVFFKDTEDFLMNFKSRVFPTGIVVASRSNIAPIVTTLCEHSDNQLQGLLHSQSYEIDMVEYLRPLEEQAAAKEYFKQAFKMLPVLSSSNWISNEIATFSKPPFATVIPGVDVDLFYSRNRKDGDDRPTVMIPLIAGNQSKGFIPGFDRIKGYDRGLILIQELERLAAEEHIDLRILVYGAKTIPIVSNAICLGGLAQTRLATILGTEVDVFVDPSCLHSYGMPALEALATGVKVFSWNNKGIEEYGKSYTGVEIRSNDTSPTEIAEDILKYLSIEHSTNQSTLDRMYIETEHNREKAVDQIIQAIEKQFNLNFISKNISIIVPHLRKHGGPTTMLALGNELSRLGHKVSIRTFYRDIKDEVVAMTDLPVSLDCYNLGKTDLIITNSDNPMTEQIGKVTTAKKIMLKLSHNPRFKTEEEKGLQQSWDAIITTSNWLKEVCENPTENWNYTKKSNVHRIGWWHYTFDKFQCHPSTRLYGGEENRPFVIATLIHNHSSKGTTEAIKILGNLFMRLKNLVKFIGIGEVPPASFTSDLPNFQYVYSPSREEMANTLKQVDVWLGASQTEGLGRMGLEAMSAGCAVVLTDTGAEYARDGENCLLYKIGDLQKADEHVMKILTNKEFAFNLRESAYRTAANAADSTSCINELQKVIENVFQN